MSFGRKTYNTKNKLFEENFKDEHIEDKAQQEDLLNSSSRGITLAELFIFIPFIFLLLFLTYSLLSNAEKNYNAQQNVLHENSFLSYFEDIQQFTYMRKNNESPLELNQKIVEQLQLLNLNGAFVQTHLQNQRTYSAFEDKIQISYSNLNSRTCKLLVQTISEKPTLNRISTIAVNDSQTLNPKETINSKTFSCLNSSNTLQINVSNI